MVFYIAMTSWVFALSVAKPDTILNNKYTSKFILWSFFILTTILIISNIDEYLYGINLIGDTVIYTNDLHDYKNFTYLESINVTGKEPFFALFSWAIAQVTTSPYVYLTAVWFFISIVLIKSLLKIFEPWKVVLIFFSFVNYPFFLSYVINGIRQGFAMSLLVFALCILLSSKKNRISFYLSIILAPLSHVSALPFSIILVLLRKFNVTFKFSLSIWILSAALLITGLNQNFLGFTASFIDSVATYSSEEVTSRYSGVNKLSFLAFSFIFLIIGLLLHYKMKMESKNKYKLLLNSYILFNSVFLLFGFIAYSNRLASFSWYIIPLLVWYPILIGKDRKYNTPLILFIVIIFLLIGFSTNLGNFLF